MIDLKNLYIENRYETIYELLQRVVNDYGMDSVLVSLSQIQEEKNKEYREPIIPYLPSPHFPPAYPYYGYNPCKNGHVFQWGSTGTTNAEPYEGCPCMCGQVRYHKNTITIS